MEPVLGKAFRDGDDLGEAGGTERGGRDTRQPSACPSCHVPAAKGIYDRRGATRGTADDVVRSMTAGLCLKQHLTASSFRTLGMCHGHPERITVSHASEVLMT